MRVRAVAEFHSPERRAGVRFAALLFIAASVATAQQPPKSSCEFDGFDLNSRLAEVNRPATAYYACETGKCFPMRLKPGDPVVITRAEAAWTCAYLVARDGSAQGWIRSADIRPVNSNPNPPLSDWAGRWTQDENRITIRLANGRLKLTGQAYWRGRGGSVNSGEVSAVAGPAGNRVHVEDHPCSIDIALIGNYLLANDNNMCGGMNVRFWGVWQRKPR